MPRCSRERVDRPAARERQDRAALLLGGLQLRAVGDVLAEALLAAALEVDRGRQPLEFRRDRAGASLEDVAVDLEGQVGERVVEGHGPGQYRPADPRRCRAVTEALRFWALIELIGLGAAPLAGVVLARLPGAGLGLGKVLGLLLVTWLVWLGGTSTLVPYGTGSAALWIALVCALGLLAWVRGWEGRRAVARGEPRGWLARRRWRRLARAGARARPAAPAAVLGRRGRVPRRLRRDGAARRLLARHLEHREADGHGVPDGRQPGGHVPARWTRGWPGADLNYYYLGHLAMAIVVKLTAVAPDEGYNLAVAALFGLAAAAVFTVAGTLWATARGDRGAVRAGLAGVALVLVAGQPRGRAPADRRRRAAARLRLVRRLARDPGHDHGVPVVLVPARRSARARAGDPVHAARAGVRAPGRARRAAPGRPRPRAARGRRRGARDRLPLRGQLVVLPGDGGPAGARAWSPGCATRAARPPGPPPSAGCSPCWRAARCSMLPFHLTFDPAARGIGVVDEGRGFARWVRDELLLFGGLAVFVAVAYAGALAGHPPAGCATRSGSRSRRCSPARSWPRVELRARRAAGRRCSSSRSPRCWRSGPRRRSGWCGCSPPAASRACSGRSCSTSATSSTAARCTG